MDVLENTQREFQSKFLFLLATLFSATWLISGIAAVKLVSFWGIVLTGSFFIFPITSILNCLIVEIYGYKNARQAIWSGFLLNLLFVFFIHIVDKIPPSPSWTLQNQFHDILVPSTRIICASVISYLISDFLNSYLLAKLKCKNYILPKRILVSTICASSIDIICFFLLAFFGTMPGDLFLKIFGYAYIKKILCQIFFLPLILILTDLIKKKEGFELYDFDTEFTPFSLNNVYDFHAYKTYSSTTSKAKISTR
ncbi:queuosine precursor transporter [Legionella maceachernii]|uniref:Queuosine precursor transporter n=1 Tax=Legionella maceachernii TaxID=466 RepID=A0A0W0VUU5_9GAMM|nr:queuosine precursor transporter [Legionella maceachernii]KTD23947.1 hypothetical protein Lmac_2820 [Legionella maceachernii]SKA18833.1 hypothetical protein SAMN02745128_02446 [Legionella maceachernii]SUP04478.1 conserved hypothetical integral membrane protein [Legionella maceachernii]